MVLRSEEHTSELQSQSNLVCRLLLEKKTNADLILRPLARRPTLVRAICNGYPVVAPVADARVGVLHPDGVDALLAAAALPVRRPHAIQTYHEMSGDSLSDAPGVLCQLVNVSVR